MSWLAAPFHYGFMQRALAEALLMAVACGLLGTLVVLRGLTFTGESLSHTLLPGAAAAIVIGASAVGGALVTGVAGAVAIGLLLGRAEVGEDAAVSVVFTGAFAAGVIILSRRGSPQDLDSVLFGSILGVDSRDLQLAAATAALVALLCLLLARRFVLVAFDRPFAAAVGLRARVYDLVLLVALAGALTVALRGMGTLLVLGLLVGPAAAARILVRRVFAMLALAPVLAAACAVVGLELSFHAGAAAGPAICLTALGLVGLVLALSPLARAARRAR
jgi:ABC-type Mn2+/Zn2+ transport system permease subunit